MSETRFKEVTLTRLTDLRGQVAITRQDLHSPPTSTLACPLTEFCFLSVISDHPDFRWLAQISNTSSFRCYLPVLMR